MGAEYIPVLMLFLFAALLAAAFIIASSLIGRPKKKVTELSPYECGVDQAMPPRRPLHVKFFAVALIFLLFDVEVALLYPWASLVRTFIANGMGRFILLEGLLFIGVLAVGLVYVLRAGALKWEE